MIPKCAVIFVVSAFIAAVSVESRAEERLFNEEYGISVMFPNNLHGCVASSGGHPHGFVARISKDQTGCDRGEASRSERAILIYANYNSAFRASADAALGNLCAGSLRKVPIPAEKLSRLSFGGRKSAVCVAERADHSIDVYVVTQNGKWPSRDHLAEFMTPYINYMAMLHTFGGEFFFSDLDLFITTLRQTSLKKAASGFRGRDADPPTDGSPIKRAR
jgi:hypothetical protein